MRLIGNRESHWYAIGGAGEPQPPALPLARRVAASLVALVVVLLAGSVTAQARAECGNEVLRSSLDSRPLPDCRAYEMVTPPYKQGYSLFPLSYSTTGDALMLYSYASLAGDPGQGETFRNMYLATRTSAGWRLASLDAPLSEFIGQIPLAYEANDGLTLWNQHTPQQSARARELYIRSREGEYSHIGPLDPHPVSEEGSDVIEAQTNDYDAPIAATHDFSHIVLVATAEEDYWSFDETKGADGSLYEYSGTGNEHPILVAVEGPKGSAHLLGECGTELGSGRLGSEYNALSSDGELVFVTVEPIGTLGCAAEAPAFAELYARLHGALISESKAETVHVSETACTEVCGAASGKNFEGASENGSKVFFTSTQKLTDSATDLTAGGDAFDGACPNIGCNLYEYDFDEPEASRLKLVAGGPSEVIGVANIGANGAWVYYVARGAVPGAGKSPFGRNPVIGAPNLYATNTESGATQLVATLSSEDQEDWRQAYARAVETAGKGGEFLLFVSNAAQVTPDETSSGVDQIFEYDATTNELVRITQGEDGFNENGNDVSPETNEATLRSIINVSDAIGQGSDFNTTVNHSNLSSDGHTVIFQTQAELSPLALSASQHCTSVYEFRSENAISDGTVHILSDGRDVQSNKGITCGAEFVALDGEGANVLFGSADELLPSDSDGLQRDIYDARIDGGFSQPVNGEIGRCVPSLCEGALTGPSAEAPASVTGAAEGNFLSRGLFGAPIKSSPSKSKVHHRGGKSRHHKGRKGRTSRACRGKRPKQQSACKPVSGRRSASEDKAKRSRRG